MHPPLKYENIAQVGDRIRSYDFHGNLHCYIEGVVQRVTDEHGYKSFAIVVDKDVWPEWRGKGKPSRVGVEFFVPMEVSFMEWDGRILNLSRVNWQEEFARLHAVAEQYLRAPNSHAARGVLTSALEEGQRLLGCESVSREPACVPGMAAGGARPA
jgi:hypothetical protein